MDIIFLNFLKTKSLEPQKHQKLKQKLSEPTFSELWRIVKSLHQLSYQDCELFWVRATGHALWSWCPPWALVLGGRSESVRKIMSYSPLLQSGWINLIWPPIHVKCQHDHKHKQEQWYKYTSANICGEVPDTYTTNRDRTILAHG